MILRRAASFFAPSFTTVTGDLALLFARRFGDDLRAFDGVVIGIDGGRDDLFNVRTQLFRARFGRFDLPVPKKRGRLVAQNGDPLFAGSA